MLAQRREVVVAASQQGLTIGKQAWQMSVSPTRCTRCASLQGILLYARTGPVAHACGCVSAVLRVLAVLLSGHDTTASLIGWTMYFLTNHPEVEAKLVDEVQRVMGSDTQPSYQQMSDMRYLNAVLKVTMNMAGCAEGWAYTVSIVVAVCIWTRMPAYNLVPRR